MWWVKKQLPRGSAFTSTRVRCLSLNQDSLSMFWWGGGAVLGRRRVRTTRIGGESRLFELYVYEVEGKKVTGWQSDSSSDNSMLSHLLYCALRLVIARTVERSTRTTTGRMDSCGREDALTTLGEPSRPTMSVWQHSPGILSFVCIFS